MHAELCKKSWPTAPGNGYTLERLIVNLGPKQVKEIWKKDMSSKKAETTIAMAKDQGKKAKANDKKKAKGKKDDEEHGGGGSSSNTKKK